MRRCARRYADSRPSERHAEESRRSQACRRPTCASTSPTAASREPTEDHFKLAARRHLTPALAKALLPTNSEEALEALEPEKIADTIVMADGHSHRLSVRRVRGTLDRRIRPRSRLAKLLKAVGRAAEYAALNHDEPTTDRAAGIVTEFGSGLFGGFDASIVTLPRGVLAENANCCSALRQAGTLPPRPRISPFGKPSGFRNPGTGQCWT